MVETLLVVSGMFFLLFIAGPWVIMTIFNLLKAMWEEYKK